MAVIAGDRGPGRVKKPAARQKAGELKKHFTELPIGLEAMEVLRRELGKEGFAEAATDAERRAILVMLAEGKITSDQASKLLDALG